jgi:hypothetical protein
MSTFALVHGAGSTGWDWHLVAGELNAMGHRVVAPDLPCEDDSAGLAEYADTVLAAVGDHEDLVVVAHSLAGFSAPLVCAKTPARLLVLLSAMVPVPGESVGQWWTSTGHKQAMLDNAARLDISTEDDTAMYLHDVPADLAGEVLRRSRGQSGAPCDEPWPLAAWPDVPTRYLLLRDDRFLPADWNRRLVADRLGIVADEMDGSHLVALSRPSEVAARLHAYLD